MNKHSTWEGVKRVKSFTYDKLCATQDGCSAKRLSVELCERCGIKWCITFSYTLSKVTIVLLQCFFNELHSMFPVFIFICSNALTV